MRTPGARDASSRAPKIDPDYAPAHARLAWIEGGIEGDLDAAARHVERGLALDPANLEVIGSAALLARLLRRFDQSIELARDLVSRDAVNERGHDRLAIAYLAAGQLDEALAEFRTVLTPSPGFASEHQYIGLVMAYHALGRKAELDAVPEELIRKYGKSLASEITSAMAYRGETSASASWIPTQCCRTCTPTRAGCRC